MKGDEELDQPKSDTVVGTFEESAFQLCLKRNHRGSLQVKLFDILGYPCVPLLGTYAESYEVCCVFVGMHNVGIVTLSKSPLCHWSCCSVILTRERFRQLL